MVATTRLCELTPRASMIPDCDGVFMPPSAFNQQNRDREGRARTDRHAHQGAPESGSARCRLRQPSSRIPEPQSLSKPRRPKISASRPKSVQPGRAFQAATGLQPNKIAAGRGRARNDRHAHEGAPEKRICPPPLRKAILRLPGPLSLGTRRPKISAYRPKSVQPGGPFRLPPAFNQKKLRPRGAEPEVTATRTKAREKLESACRSLHKPSAVPGTRRPESWHLDQNLCSPWPKCAEMEEFQPKTWRQNSK
jgi:hypothetical protein